MPFVEFDGELDTPNKPTTSYTEFDGTLDPEESLLSKVGSAAKSAAKGIGQFASDVVTQTAKDFDPTRKKSVMSDETELDPNHLLTKALSPIATLIGTGNNIKNAAVSKYNEIVGNEPDKSINKLDIGMGKPTPTTPLSTEDILSNINRSPRDAAIANFIKQGASPKVAENIVDGIAAKREVNISSGMSPEDAGNLAAEQASNPLGGIKNSTFDFDTKQKYKDANEITRGIAKFHMQAKNQALGAHQFVADTIGADDYSAAMSKGRTENNAVLDAIGEGKSEFSRNVEGAVSSILSNLPGLMTGAAIPALSVMAVQDFSEEYANGKQQGLSYQDRIDRAALHTSSEIAGEIFGLKDTLKGLRSIGSGATTAQVIEHFGKAAVKEIPGEELTTFLEYSADKFGTFGLTPEATMSDYLKQVKDTLFQTVLQSGMMMGGGAGANKAVQLAKKLETPEKALGQAMMQDVNRAKPNPQSINAAAVQALDPNGQLQVSAGQPIPAPIPVPVQSQTPAPIPTAAPIQAGVLTRAANIAASVGIAPQNSDAALLSELQTRQEKPVEQPVSALPDFSSIVSKYGVKGESDATIPTELAQAPIDSKTDIRDGSLATDVLGGRSFPDEPGPAATPMATGPTAAPIASSGQDTSTGNAGTNDKALILTSKGKPFSLKTVAELGLKARNLDKTHEVVPIEGGFALAPKQVAETLAKEAQPAESQSIEAPIEAPNTLSIGTTPKAADQITVKDGVIHIGDYPAQNFDTGEDVAIKSDATNEQIRDALVDAGAVGSGQKIFGLPPKAKKAKSVTKAVDDGIRADNLSEEKPSYLDQEGSFSLEKRNVFIPNMTVSKLKRLLTKPIKTKNDLDDLRDFKYFLLTDRQSAIEKGFMDSYQSDGSPVYVLKNKFWLVDIDAALKSPEKHSSELEAASVPKADEGALATTQTTAVQANEALVPTEAVQPNEAPPAAKPASEMTASELLRAAADKMEAPKEKPVAKKPEFKTTSGDALPLFLEKFGQEKPIYGAALRQANDLLGAGLGVKFVVLANGKSNAPMLYRRDSGTIVVNSEIAISQAQAVQFMVEELIHHVDSLSDSTALSGEGNHRLNLDSGDLAKEAIEAYQADGEFSAFLSYPLSKSHGLSKTDIQAELFARLPVLYLGNPSAMKRILPKSYEAYHGIFTDLRKISGPLSGVREAFRQGSTEVGDEVGGGHQPASTVRTDSARSVGQESTTGRLGYFRRAFARAIEASGGKSSSVAFYSRDGNKAKFSSQPTPFDNDERAQARKSRSENVDDDYRLPNIHNAVPKEYVPKQASQQVVTIYRGAPSTVENATIRPGDWVSLDKAYAEQHGTGEMGSSKVISIEVPADHVAWAGTDMNEWFYAPRDTLLFSRSNRPANTPPTQGHTPASLTTRINNVLESQAKGLSSLMGSLIKVDRSNEDIPARILGGDTLYSVGWHGSPERFGKFSSEYMGNGEGAQGFGWGHYVADDQGLADWYRKKLTYDTAPVLIVDGVTVDYEAMERRLEEDSEDVEAAALLYLAAENGNKETAIVELESDKRIFYKKQAEYLKRTDIQVQKGQLYKVEIPEDDTFLLWDKPLNEQPLKVIEALKKGYKEQGGEYPEKSATPKNGKEIYNNFKVFTGGSLSPDAKAASEYLQSIGISGIKYLDGRSRSKGYGSFNYVVFDDNAIQITDTLYSKSGDIRAYIDPLDNTVHVIAGNIPSNFTDKELLGLLTHEIGVHIAHLGKSNAEFQSILAQAESMRKMGNKKMQKAYDRAISAGTSEENLAEESISYFLEANPTNSLTQKFVSWFRKMLRKLGLNLKDADKYRVFQWADKLTEGDIIRMASDALRNAANETINVDGIDRPTTNSEGRKIHYTENGIVNFWRWFNGVVDSGKESKQPSGDGSSDQSNTGEGQRGTAGNIDELPNATPVAERYITDASGRPRVFFHGTADDITRFDPNHENRYDTGWLGRGVYLTSDSKLANSYADFKSEDNHQNVMPMYAAVHNPFVATVELKRKISNWPQQKVDEFTQQKINEGYDGSVLTHADGSIELVAFSPELVKSAVGNTGQFSPATTNILFSKTTKDIRAAAWKILAGDMGIFQNKTPDSFDMESAAREIDPHMRAYEDVPEPDKPSIVKKWLISMPDKSHAYAYENDKGQVWLDASRLKEGASSGTKLYLLVGSYAEGNGKVFIGDPAGLSEIALLRRTENMLSLALRFGTTKFMEPHKNQVNPNGKFESILGDVVRPIKWVKGDDENNLAELLKTSYANTAAIAPEIKNVTFNFDKGRFEYADGSEFTNADFDRVSESTTESYRADGLRGILARTRVLSSVLDEGRLDALRSAIDEYKPSRKANNVAGASKAGHKNNDEANGKADRPPADVQPGRVIGSATLKRAAITNTLSRAEGEGRGGRLLAQIGELIRGELTPIKGILYSKSQSKETSSAIPEETPFQAKQRIIQDKFNRFDVLQKWLKDQGVNLSEEADVYLAETLMSSRIATRKQDFREQQMDPLIKETQSADITMEQIGDFLKMQHAPEANKRAREIHADPNKTAFGVTDADAAQAMAGFKTLPNFADLKRLANKWRDVTEQSKKILVDSGILSPEMAKAWEDTYQVYVPVKGTDDQAGTGKGLNVNGKQKLRLGHALRDEAIIENIWRDYERAVSLDEKNLVGKALIRFGLEAKNDEILTIGKPEKRQVLKKGETNYMVSYDGSDVVAFDNKRDAQIYIDKAVLKKSGNVSDFLISKTSDPVRVMLQASPMLADNEVNVYVGGHAVRVQINDEIAAREYTNLGVEHLNAILSAGRSVNTFLSQMYTGKSPDFIFTNPIRDAIQGSVTLIGNHGAVMTAKIFANYPLAVKELFKHFRKPGSSAIVTDYRANGGSTGAAYLSDLERIGNDMQAAYNEYAGMIATYNMMYKKAISDGKSEARAHSIAALKAGFVGIQKIPVIGHILRLMERINSITENALRVATYHTLVKNGVSKKKAAAEAKNLMNFNRKGEISNQAGALYLFFNPNIQSTQVFYKALFESEHKGQARTLAGMMVLSGYLLAELARSGGDDDKDKWKNTPDYVKDANMIFGIGDFQITIPQPYGYRVFHTLGNVLSDYVHGTDGYKLGIRLASSVFASFSPIGNPMEGEHGLFQLLPTIPKALLGPGVNEDSFGRAIMPQSYNKSKPDSQLMNRKTKGSVYAETAEWMNETTGGSKYESGQIDVSPETLKYWVSTLTGGAGKAAFDTINMMSVGAQDVVPATRDIPIIRRFVREVGVSDLRAAFYERANEAKKSAEAFSAARRGRDNAAAKDMWKKNGPLIELSHYADNQKKLIGAKADLIDNIRNDDKLTLAQKQTKMAVIEAEESVIYNRFIKQFDRKTNAKSLEKN